MDRVSAVLRCQWRAYWRRIKRAGNVSSGNVGLLVIVGGLALIRFFQQLPLLKAQLAKGTGTKYEIFLAIVFCVWLLPVMGESRRSIAVRSLLHLPFTTLELYAIRVGSVVISPITWTIASCVLIMSYFVSSAPNPVLGIASLWILSVLGFFCSLTISHLLSHSSMRKALFFLMVLASILFGLTWFGDQRTLSSIDRVWQFLPNRLAASVAVSPRPWSPFLELIVLTGVAFVASLSTFKLSLHSSEKKRVGGFSLISNLPGRLGGLVKKDLRYALRLLDVYLVVPVLIVMDIYLVTNPEPAASVVWISTIALLFPLMSLAFNCFGLDSPLGMDRYQLLPLSRRDLIVTKNLAFALMVFLLFSFMWPLVVWKLGWAVTGVALLQLVLGLLAYFSVGNLLSVKQPFRMQFYRFASGGSPVDAMMGLLFCSLPSVITIYWLVQLGYAALWRVAPIMAVCGVIYWLSLNRSARALERRYESIRATLT